MCRNASIGGHLELLQWLRLLGKLEGQCDWDELTCRAAAEGGDLEVLQWLRSGDDPCPWDRNLTLDRRASPGMRRWIKTQPE